MYARVCLCTIHTIELLDTSSVLTHKRNPRQHLLSWKTYTHSQIHLQEGSTAAVYVFPAGNSVDFMYMPQVETAKGKTWIGEDGVSTYKLDNCDTTAAPYMRDAPVQVF
jgi:hypothetical protein